MIIIVLVYIESPSNRQARRDNRNLLPLPPNARCAVSRGRWLVDVVSVTQSVSCFFVKAGPIHGDGVKRICRHLKGTKDLWLSFGGMLMGVMAEDRHAISGHIFVIHDPR